MRCSRGDDEVDPIPEEGEWRCIAIQGWRDAGIIIDMLNWMHTKPSKRFDICVAMMQAVHIFVEYLVRH